MTASAWKVGGALTLIAVMLMGLGWYRQHTVRAQPLLPVAFDHVDHTSVQCTECHHNFIDDTGAGMCFSCHKYTREINLDIQPMFHKFCRGCHIETRLGGDDAGPVRECGLCHTRADI